MELAQFAASTTALSISESFIAILPILLLDVVAAVFCGLGSQLYSSSVEAVQFVHGYGNGSLAAFDGSESSLAGVMYLNGIAAGLFQYEHVIRHAHPASSVFPALFTVAAQQHSAGEDFLTALAVGYEISSRIGLASGKEVEAERGFHNPAINGQLATAAAIGNLLGWDEELIASAMGVAASSSAGLVAFQTTNAMTKQIQPGHGSALGAEAAFMAAAGVRGPTNILENPKGFLKAFSPKPNATALTAGLYDQWVADNQIVKLFPMHSTFQILVSAMVDYREENDPWVASDIAEVTVFAGPRLLSSSHRILHPETVDHALYSTPFCIAMSVLFEEMRNPLLTTSETMLSNEAIQELSGEVQFVEEYDDPESLVGRVEVRLKDGTVHTIDAPYDSYRGYRSHPEHATAIKDKYRGVVDYLDVIDEAKALEKLLKCIGSVKDVSDVYQQMVITGSAISETLSR